MPEFSVLLKEVKNVQKTGPTTHLLYDGQMKPFSIRNSSPKTANT